MQQLKGLLRDTWWLWVFFFAFNTFLAVFVSRLYLALYPALVIAAVYFAFVRYDADGKEKQTLQ